MQAAGLTPFRFATDSRAEQDPEGEDGLRIDPTPRGERRRRRRTAAREEQGFEGYNPRSGSGLKYGRQARGG